MYTNDDKTLQMNTTLDMRKTPIDEKEQTPRQSKNSKDDTNKNPYHSLDEKDPGRHMMDKEILESK